MLCDDVLLVIVGSWGVYKGRHLAFYFFYVVVDEFLFFGVSGGFSEGVCFLSFEWGRRIKLLVIRGMFCIKRSCSNFFKLCFPIPFEHFLFTKYNKLLLLLLKN